jgi:ligand-binding SRPBCC domain-containing protein
MSYRLVRRQSVGGSVDEVFAYFKDPRNLESLTPPWLGFRLMGSSDPEVRLGTTIRYRLRLHGIPLRWESAITEYQEGQAFADEMTRGPYRRWYHRHLFRPMATGVEIEDIVDYELPFGPVGRLVHAALVRRQLTAIFDYRVARMGERFPLIGRPSGPTTEPAQGKASGRRPPLERGSGRERDHR